MKYWTIFSGFYLTLAQYDYRWEYARCQNETIRAEEKREKFFVQPSFPNVNNAEFDCIWRLQAPEGMRIKISWPVFHLDTCHGSGGNKLLGNAVTIVDGKADDTSNDFVQFCGHKGPPDFVSSTRDLHILLKQKKQEHGKGVKIMCGFEATNLPATNVQRGVGLQSTQSVDKIARIPDDLRAEAAESEIQTILNVAVEESQSRSDFADHYFYDYQEEREEKIEQIRMKKLQDRLEKRRQLESTLKYKFQAMPKEDQWALIGGGVSFIVLIILVTYMIIMRRKKIDIDEIASSSLKRGSMEKRSSLEKR